MTKLTMNQVNLETAIKNLRDLADDCESARDEVVQYYNDGGDTLERHGHNEPDDFSLAVNAAITKVRDRADDIERHKNDIVTLNESGVAPMDADGVITLTTPDNVEYPDDSTHTDFVAWAEGVIDATELDSITSGKISSTDRVPSGRSYDEIVASIQAHQNDNDYADTFINRIGPENLTSLPLNAQQYFTYQPPTGDPVNNRPEAAGDLASLLGSVLATASLKWTRERSQQAADAIVSSVDEEGEYGRITVLNAMLGEHDANGDHINDLKFGRDLLIDLAEGLDDIDYKAVAVGASYPERGKGGEGTSFSQGEADARGRILGPSLNGYSFDPLTGVLDAMGNNRFAALGYLAPMAEDGTVDTSRVDELSNRSWDQKGMAGYTAALAAGSALRGNTIGYQGHQDERAAQMSGHAIHGLAQNATTELNNDTKAHIGVLIGNNPDEVTAAWGTGIHGVSGNADALISSSTAEQLGTATVSDLDALASRVADSADATATISTGLANYASRRSKTGVAAHEGDPDQQIDAIVDAYGDGAAAAAHLVGIADSRAKDKTAEEISNETELNGSASTVILAFSTVAAGVLTPTGVTAPTMTLTAGTLLAPVMADALTDDPQTASSPVSLRLTDGMMAAAAQDAAQAGLINQDSYQVGPTKDDPDIQTAADQYSWVVDDGHGGHTIDLSGTSKEDLAGVNTWASQVADSNRVDQIPPDPRLVRLKDAITDAATRGYVRGSSSTVDHSSGG